MEMANSGEQGTVALLLPSGVRVWGGACAPGVAGSECLWVLTNCPESQLLLRMGHWWVNQGLGPGVFPLPSFLPLIGNSGIRCPREQVQLWERE